MTRVPRTTALVKQGIGPGTARALAKAGRHRG